MDDRNAAGKELCDRAKEGVASYAKIKGIELKHLGPRQRRRIVEEEIDYGGCDITKDSKPFSIVPCIDCIEREQANQDKTNEDVPDEDKTTGDKKKAATRSKTKKSTKG